MAVVATRILDPLGKEYIRPNYFDHSVLNGNLESVLLNPISLNSKESLKPSGFSTNVRVRNSESDMSLSRETPVKNGIKPKGSSEQKNIRGSLPKSLSPQGARYRTELLTQIQEKEKTETLLNSSNLLITEAPIISGKGFRYLTKDAFGQGQTYFGDWKNNQPSGFGIKKYPDGSSYEGQWLEGLEHGQGKAEYISSGKREIIIEGIWDRGVPISGNYYFSEASDYRVYSGTLNNYQPNGSGTLEYRNGIIYSGQVKAGKEEGFGKMNFPDSTTYEGNFHAGQFFGWGIYKSKGFTYEGYWLFGKAHGFGTITYQDESWYTGYFDMGSFQGKGVYFKNVLIEAKWSDGKVVVAPLLSKMEMPLIPKVLEGSFKVNSDN